jgi:hypothetical protein
LEKTKFFVFVERNTGMESGHLKKAAEGYYRVEFVYQRQGINPGWWTGNAEKLEYAYSARDQMVYGAVLMLKDMVCTNKAQKPNTRAKETKKKLIDQMTRYRLVVSTPGSPFNKETVTVTGKVDEKGKISQGFNDDLMFAFTMANKKLEDVLAKKIEGLDYTMIKN